MAARTIQLSEALRLVRETEAAAIARQDKWAAGEAYALGLALADLASGTDPWQGCRGFQSEQRGREAA